MRSVFLLNVLYLKLWPKPFCWKIQLITICTKCFPLLKSLVSELHRLFVMGKKNQNLNDYKELCTVITSINKV